MINTLVIQFLHSVIDFENAKMPLNAKKEISKYSLMGICHQYDQKDNRHCNIANNNNNTPIPIIPYFFHRIKHSILKIKSFLMAFAE